MKKTILFIIAIALVLPFSVKAECDYEREAELSRIASNVQFSYTYRMNNNGSLVFDVNIINVPEDIYIIESENNNKITGNETTLTYGGNRHLRYDIYSNDINCRGEHILTQYVNLPKFNYYSTTEKCKENPDFEYCQTWLNVDIDEEEFNQALNDYQTEINNNQKSTKKENWLVTLFGENYQIMISLISISVVILIVYFVGGKRRQR